MSRKSSSGFPQCIQFLSPRFNISIFRFRISRMEHFSRNPRGWWESSIIFTSADWALNFRAGRPSTTDSLPQQLNFLCKGQSSWVRSLLMVSPARELARKQIQLSRPHLRKLPEAWACDKSSPASSAQLQALTQSDEPVKVSSNHPPGPRTKYVNSRPKCYRAAEHQEQFPERSVVQFFFRLRYTVL